jgi:hypothetical protein
MDLLGDIFDRPNQDNPNPRLSTLRRIINSIQKCIQARLIGGAVVPLVGISMDHGFSFVFGFL